MATVLAAALHVGKGGSVDVAIRLLQAYGACMRAIAGGPALSRGSPRALAAGSFFSASLSSASASASSSAAASLLSAATASLVVAVAVDLGLKAGDGGLERLHLVEHGLALLGSVCHVGDLEGHLLFSHHFGSCVRRDCCVSDLLGLESIDDLVDDRGGVGLSMVAESVGGDCGLATNDGSLGISEVCFESSPSFVGEREVMPVADVGGEDGGPSDDDESNVDEVVDCLATFSCCGHVGAPGDGCEDVGKGLGVVVNGGFQGGLFFGENLGSNCSKGPVEIGKYFRDCALDETGVFVDEVGEAVVVEGGIDLLNDGTLDLVASVEGVGLCCKEAMGLGDLCCRCEGQIWEDWEDGTNKWHSWGASFVS